MQEIKELFNKIPTRYKLIGGCIIFIFLVYHSLAADREYKAMKAQKEQQKQQQAEQQAQIQQLQQETGNQIYITESQEGTFQRGTTSQDIAVITTFRMTNKSQHTVSGILTVRSISKRNGYLGRANIGFDDLAPGESRDLSFKINVASVNETLGHYEKEILFSKIDDQVFDINAKK